MNRRRALGLAAAAPLIAGWRWPFSRDVVHRNALIVAGSGRMLPYNRDIEALFEQENSDINVVCEGGGSYPALLALKRGLIDIAAISQELSRHDDDPRLRLHLVAKDAVALIVNPKNPIQSVTREDLREIMEGRQGNWGMFGGGDTEIDLIDRRGGDPTDRAEAVETVLGHHEPFKNVAAYVGSDEEMIKAVAANPDALGFCGWEDLTPDVRPLAIAGVPLSRETMLSGSYPFAWPYYYVTLGPPNPTIDRFLAFTRTEQVQAMLAKGGLLRVY